MRKQFGELVFHILAVLVHVAAFVGFGAFLRVARSVGVLPVVCKVGMVPVDKRIIEANPDTLGTESLYERTDEVFAIRRVRYLEIGVLGVPHAEAFVVFCGDNHILYAGRLCISRPLLGVVQVGIKVLEIAVVIFVAYSLILLYPLVPCGQAVQPPMDEHAEPVVRPPGHALGFLFFRFVGPRRYSLFLLGRNAAKRCRRN